MSKRLNPVRSRVFSMLILILLLCISIAVTFFSKGQDWMSDALFLRQTVQQQPWVSWLWFSLAAFISQLLIIPSGTLLMLFGGFLLGAPAATIIFFIAQLITAILLVWLGHRSGVENVGYSLSRWNEFLKATVESLHRVPLSLGIVLRLFPILPSAVACLLSVVFAIPLRTFLLATALVGWIRPLLFASAGALLPSLLDFQALRSEILVQSLIPVSLLFFSGLLLLFTRLWLNHKTGTAKQG